ncbi:death-on-curing family protein [Priestia filamentosa]|uniref:Death-on-curing family protein n=1 Tax=Priestia filamentosa TaxID=1402861 RepID=A0A0H4KI38_9BACI|nr:type II toxin-antitoxin system death-on-curing family toxin [Priestia filamentosa]AKO91964.1 death-on-curing family protein [Priestia filamentosa]
MIKYLTVSQVIKINERMILMYNDKEQIGVKDLSLLESAVNRPKQSIFLEDAYKSIFEKAVALFESIAKNHAFHNGNKRTALMCLVVFLKMNEVEFIMDDNEADDFVVDVVNKKLDFYEIVKVVKENCMVDGQRL